MVYFFLRLWTLKWYHCCCCCCFLSTVTTVKHYFRLVSMPQLIRNKFNENKQIGKQLLKNWLHWTSDNNKWMSYRYSKSRLMWSLWNRALWSKSDNIYWMMKITGYFNIVIYSNKNKLENNCITYSKSG